MARSRHAPAAQRAHAPMGRGRAFAPSARPAEGAGASALYRPISGGQKQHGALVRKGQNHGPVHERLV